MGKVGALVEFTAQTTIVSDDIDQNFADLKAAINSAVFIDETVTISQPLRLANNVALLGRNAADSGDISLISLDTNDLVRIGADLFNLPIDGTLSIALGGGAAATLGTIGGSGPASAGQTSWLKVTLDGVNRFIPMWT